MAIKKAMNTGASKTDEMIKPVRFTQGFGCPGLRV
jgi:hypothetical protein